MPVTVVEVHASSRLHFGMFSFAQPGRRQFGGVGAMVGQGTVKLRIEPADRFTAEGPLAERVLETARRFGQVRGDAALPACRVQVVTAPRQHVGLGVGTQLALSVCAGLHTFLGGDRLEAEALALLSGRGARFGHWKPRFRLGRIAGGARKARGRTTLAAGVSRGTACRVAFRLNPFRRSMWLVGRGRDAQPFTICRPCRWRRPSGYGRKSRRNSCRRPERAILNDLAIACTDLAMRPECASPHGKGDRSREPKSNDWSPGFASKACEASARPHGVRPFLR